jgi:hypothetical protein
MLERAHAAGATHPQSHMPTKEPSPDFLNDVFRLNFALESTESVVY